MSRFPPSHPIAEFSARWSVQPTDIVGCDRRPYRTIHRAFAGRGEAERRRKRPSAFDNSDSRQVSDGKEHKSTRWRAAQALQHLIARTEVKRVQREELLFGDHAEPAREAPPTISREEVGRGQVQEFCGVRLNPAEERSAGTTRKVAPQRARRETRCYGLTSTGTRAPRGSNFSALSSSHRDFGIDRLM